MAATTQVTITNQLTVEDAHSLVCTEKKFNSTYITKIATTSKALRSLVQDAGIQALLRAFGDDDFSYLTKLYETVSQSMSKANAKQLKEWIQTNSPAQLRKTDDGQSFRKNTKDDAQTFDFEKAFTVPWFDIELLSRDEAKAMFSATKFDTRIERLIKDAEKAIEAESLDDMQEASEILSKIETLKSLLGAVTVADTVEEEVAQAA